MATPNSKFVIFISAVDQVTAVAKRVDKSLADLASPFEKVGGAAVALTNATGIAKVGSAIGDVAKQSFVAARGLAEMAAPFGVVFGAASVASIAEASAEWAHMTGEITRLADATGVGVMQIQSLQGASRIAGSSSVALAGGLEGIAHNLHEINAFRNVEGMAVFSMLRIATGSLRSPRNPAIVLRDLSAAIVRFKDPVTQLKIAEEAMGSAGRELLPLLRQGPQAFDAFVASAQHFGYQLSGPQVEAGRKLEQTWEELRLSGEGMASMLGTKLAPVLTPMLHDLSEWVVANREWITTDVAEYVRQIGDAVRQVDWNGFAADTRAVVDDVKSLTDSMGGAKVAVGLFLGLLAADKIAAVVSLGTAIGGVGIAAGKMGIRVGVLATETLPALSTQGALAAEALGQGKLATAFLEFGAAVERVPLGSLTRIVGTLGPIGTAGALLGGASLYGSYRFGQYLTGQDKDMSSTEAAQYAGLSVPGIGIGFGTSIWAARSLYNWAYPGAAGSAVSMLPAGANGPAAALPSAADMAGIGGSPWDQGPVEVNLTFQNVPAGMQVEASPNGSGPRARVNVQYAMPGGPL